MPRVLGRSPQLLCAIRAVCVHRLDGHGVVVREFLLTVSANNFPVPVFPVDPQLVAASRARYKMTACRHDPCRIDFLERHELRDLDAVFGEFRVEECAAGLAVDEIGRHFITALRTVASLPRALNALGELSKFR